MRKILDELIARLADHGRKDLVIRDCRRATGLIDRQPPPGQFTQTSGFVRIDRSRGAGLLHFRTEYLEFDLPDDRQSLARAAHFIAFLGSTRPRLTKAPCGPVARVLDAAGPGLATL